MTAWELQRRIRESALPRHLKATLSNLARHGDGCGNDIWPSVDRVGWELAKGERAVRKNIVALLRLKVLVEVGPKRWVRRAAGTVLTSRFGGVGHTTEYRIDPEALPERELWVPKSERKEADAAESKKRQWAAAERRNWGSVKGGTGVPRKAELGFRRSVSDLSGDLSEEVQPAASPPATPAPQEPTKEPTLPGFLTDVARNQRRRRPTDHEARDSLSREPAADDNYAVLLALFLEVLNVRRDESIDLDETVKSLAAMSGINYYNNDVFRRARDSALAIWKRELAKGRTR